MTMMGNSFLNDIVSEDEIYEPSEILLMLDRKIKESLQGSGGKIQDGMDMGILTVDEENQKILYAGAKNPLCRVRNGEIERIKGSIFAVGGSDFGREKKYEQYEFPIERGDIYYMFSDGYQDQFGTNGRKFMSKKFRQFLLTISDMKFSEQKVLLSQTLDNWMGNSKQTDDILVVGVKIQE
jgi:serine phosphatase RsbU (regulator of sigma subunit)